MSTPQDDIDNLIEALQGEYHITFVLSDAESELKLSSLKDGGRDFFAITPQLEKFAQDGIKTATGAFQPGKADQYLKYVIGKMGTAVLKHVVTRFTGKRDVRMSPLSRDWVKEKGHSRIGIYSNDLFKDLLNAEVEVTKK